MSLGVILLLGLGAFAFVGAVLLVGAIVAMAMESSDKL